VSSASLISLSVRWRMKTGLPRHLIMTCSQSAPSSAFHRSGPKRTFLPSGMAARSISTLAWAKTSAEADMLTRKSVAHTVSGCLLHRTRGLDHLQNGQLLLGSSRRALSCGAMAAGSAGVAWAGVAYLPWTVAFAPMAVSAPMVPTMKYWKTLAPCSPPLFRYAAKEGILVESGLLLKGLSNDDAEALRIWMAEAPALATGSWWAVHERAIARVVLARAGIVDAGVRVVGDGDDVP
jgi:hypothetical protein